jgi:C1A family cysteine protease
MGPVAAEISGGSKIFKFYSGGIIDDMALMEQGVDAKSDLVCSAGKVNHAVLIVGWGIEDNGDEYFMIKNSFGTDWGENGYAKISTKASRRLPLGSCNILSSVLAPWFQEME